MTKEIEQINLISIFSRWLSYLRRYGTVCFMTYYLHTVYFSCQNPTVTGQSLNMIRIRLDPHWFGSLDPNLN
jgi:hypothetical protein